jgi:conjugation system TraG family ATPase
MPAKQTFNLPYAGIAREGEYDLLYSLNGDCSIVFSIDNPVKQYAAESAAYDDYHNLLLSVIRLLGDGYILQKQDIFSRATYAPRKAAEYLQEKYNAHFQGRDYIRINTYLIITRQARKGAFYVYDRKALTEFIQVIGKVADVLLAAKTNPVCLDEKAIDRLVLQTLCMNFAADIITLENMAVSDTGLKMGSRSVRNVSLINTDHIDLPATVGTHMEWNEKEALKGFPVDLFSFLLRVPVYESLLYNQVIEIAAQAGTIKKLELKKKRHSGIPDPVNLLCTEDIEQLLADAARENQLLVNCHFNMVVAAPDKGIQKAVNFIERSLFGLGIIPGRNAYNQLELFRTALPGNAAELKKYDWFLTTSDAALCFFFKESLPKSEPSDFLVRFTDRQGVPVGIDPSDLPMRTGRINNRNKFVLGPSGSGKSFFMNSLIEQYMLYNMDVVIVDTGHSYSGLCAYYKGKYITYSDADPITMNPFAINAEEYTIEKKDFLCTLICLLWKGATGTILPVERDVIAYTVAAYFSAAFETTDPVLNFNTFYEFALQKIPEIKTEDRVVFDLDEFRYVLKKFYKGGEFASILNEQTDQSLFAEPFIVFEIDAIKEHKILFPIVTLIIMDVFIQKMRYRSARRKTLVVEEAWKAVASPLMAGYLLYLYKTVRKFWGEAIVVTQELSDIIGNAVIKDSIINNSDTICLLDQTRFRDNYNEIASLLSIGETERKKIFTLNQLDNMEDRGRFKEVYIRRGAKGEVYGVEVSLHQYLTYTTEKPEKSAVEIYTWALGTYRKGLDAFVDDLRKSGLPMEQFIAAVNKNGKPAS